MLKGIYGRTKEPLLIKDLKPSLNENVDSEKLFSSKSVCILSVFDNCLNQFPDFLIGI